MTDSSTTSAAERLCTACGMCCNGVMFHMVRIQPADSPRALVALGLKLKKKKKQLYILQPCPAFRDQQCSIYQHRPERCRLFECRQLIGVAAGELTEVQALENIREAQQRVQALNELLEQAGKTNEKRPLSKRCEKIMVELGTESAPEAISLRDKLATAMQDLNGLLNQKFRLQPIGDVTQIEAVVDDEGNEDTGMSADD